MPGSMHTICVSLEVLTAHVAAAMSTLGGSGPNPAPTTVKTLPPVRLHKVTLDWIAVEPHPATPVMVGKTNDTALNNVAVRLPDVIVRVKFTPAPAGNMNCTCEDAASNTVTWVAANVPTTTVNGTYKN